MRAPIKATAARIQRLEHAKAAVETRRYAKFLAREERACVRMDERILRWAKEGVDQFELREVLGIALRPIALNAGARGGGRGGLGKGRGDHFLRLQTSLHRGGKS